AGTPTGTVSFFDGIVLVGTATLDAGGTATFTTSDLGVGIHALTAVYSGDSAFNGSTSPASVFGQPKVLTATVTATAPGAGTPTGTVSFFDGVTLLGTGTVVAGVATFTTSGLGVGIHALTAVYSGDTSFNGSTSPIDPQTVTTADTTTALTSAPDPSVFGQ
uniref:Ig-like domain-containing protein n=1 Tax=Streptomyces novaecaesareae TaxID=68244 RepID=UPI0005275494